MMNITTLQEVKAHLRYDSDDSDLELEIYRQSAEQMVLDYVTDDFTDGQYPKQFKTAVLLMCGYFDQNRNLESDMQSDGNYLPAPIRQMLYKYRTPTVG